MTARVGSARSAFTTQRAPTVASARVDILEMHPDATAGVCNSFIRQKKCFIRQKKNDTVL